jgi:hypothetical protein
MENSVSDASKTFTDLVSLLKNLDVPDNNIKPIENSVSNPNKVFIELIDLMEHLDLADNNISPLENNKIRIKQKKIITALMTVCNDFNILITGKMKKKKPIKTKTVEEFQP